MCERDMCRMCEFGESWLKKVRSKGHENPSIALGAMFLPPFGDPVANFLKDYCPGDKDSAADQKMVG